MRTAMIGLIFCLFSVPVFSASSPDDGPGIFASIYDQHLGSSVNQSTLLADASSDEISEPEPGSLIIPGENESKEKKKCLNVCKKWGENCIINPRTGRRDCRRTCKEFGEECF